MIVDNHNTQQARHHKGILAAILIASFALRMALIVLNPHPTLVGDMPRYHETTLSLIESGQFPNGHWPLYPASLVLSYTLFPDDLAGARIIQAIASMVTVLMVYIATRRTFDPRAALFAAGLTAFQPALIFYSDYLLTETLYTMFLSMGFVVTLLAPSRMMQKRGILWGMLAGLVFGLLALTRGTLGAILLPASLLWLILWHRLRALPYSIAAAVVFMMVISPWLIHNAQTYDWMTLSTRTGRDFYAGNNPMADGLWGHGVSYLDDPESPLYGLSFLEQSRRGTSEGVKWILHHPADFAAKGINALRYLYDLPGYQAYAYHNGFYEPSALQHLGWIAPTAMAALGFAGLVLLYVAGTALNIQRPAVQLIFLLLVAISASAFITYGDSHFLLPLLPLMSLPASAVIAHPRDSRRPQLAVIVPVLLLLGINWLVLAWESFQAGGNGI